MTFKTSSRKMAVAAAAVVAATSSSTVAEGVQLRAVYSRGLVGKMVPSTVEHSTARERNALWITQLGRPEQVTPQEWSEWLYAGHTVDPRQVDRNGRPLLVRKKFQAPSDAFDEEKLRGPTIFDRKRNGEYKWRDMSMSSKSLTRRLPSRERMESLLKKGSSMILYPYPDSYYGGSSSIVRARKNNNTGNKRQSIVIGERDFDNDETDVETAAPSPTAEEQVSVPVPVEVTWNWNSNWKPRRMRGSTFELEEEPVAPVARGRGSEAYADADAGIPPTIQEYQEVAARPVQFITPGGIVVEAQSDPLEHPRKGKTLMYANL